MALNLKLTSAYEVTRNCEKLFNSGIVKSYHVDSKSGRVIIETYNDSELAKEIVTSIIK